MWWICACTCVYVCIWWMHVYISMHSMHTSYKTQMHIFVGNMYTQRTAQHAWSICFEQRYAFFTLDYTKPWRKKHFPYRIEVNSSSPPRIPAHDDVTKQTDIWVNLGLSSGWRLRESNIPWLRSEKRMRVAGYENPVPWLSSKGLGTGAKSVVGSPASQNRSRELPYRQQKWLLSHYGWTKQGPIHSKPILCKNI